MPKTASPPLPIVPQILTELILQSDILRPLRLPAVLVGDGRLGGISTTLAAFEMLCHRGFDVAAVAILESAESPNAAAIQAQLARSPSTPTRVFSLPICAAPTGRCIAAEHIPRS